MKIAVSVLSMSLALAASVQAAQAAKMKINRSPAQTVAASAPTVTPVLKNQAMSENFYQLDNSKQALQVGARSARVDSAAKVRNGGSATTTTSGFLAEVKYMRGLQNGWMASAESKLGTVENTTSGENSYRDSGFTDLVLRGQRITRENDRNQFFGIFASISPATKEMGYDISAPGFKGSKTGNLWSGGHALGASLGTERNTIDRVVGFRGRGQLNFEKRAQGRGDAGTVELSQTGGHELAGEAFMEMPKKNALIGVSAGLTWVMSSDISGKSSGSASNINATRDGHQILNLGAYGQYSLNPRISLLPSLGINKLLTASGGANSLELSDEVALTVGARFAL